MSCFEFLRLFLFFAEEVQLLNCDDVGKVLLV